MRAGAWIDGVIARGGSGSDGVVTRPELRRAGVSGEAVDRRIRSGLLVPVHRGVYVVAGVPLGLRGRHVAALAAAGSAAVLSHGSSGSHWGLLPPRGRIVHVTAPTHRRSVPGIRCHQVELPSRSVTVRDGLPCTTVARTLIGIAGDEGEVAVVRAWGTAATRRLIRVADVEFEVDRAAGRPGVAHVRRLLLGEIDYRTGRPRSPLEARALELVRAAGLPTPAVNQLVVIGDEVFEVDLVWGPQRLAVEVDGRNAHEHALGFDTDRERDNVFGLAGWRSLRWTHRDLEERAGSTIANLRARLAQPPLMPAPGVTVGRARSRSL